MAADLATTPDSGLRVQACGDAHLANFGAFSSPERDLLFDTNDFDETAPGPFEWDLKRLAASFVIAARDRAFTAKVARECALQCTKSYRDAMVEFAGMSNLAVWYAKMDMNEIVTRWRSRVTADDIKRFESLATKAQEKDSTKALVKLAKRIGGQYRIISDPPLVVPIRDLAAEQGIADVGRLEEWLHERFRTYRHTLQPDRRRLLESYRIVDMARKVVGVGSVGTRCWIMLLLGKDDTDPLFLQIKEAEESVLERFVGKSGYANHGQRVVEGQRLLQASSDILLGWTRAAGLDGVERDFYVRQLWDGKMSANLETMSPEVMKVYAQLCGWTLAHGHARSGDRVTIAAYVGSGDVFDNAIADFAAAYADQNERDFERVASALKAVPAS